MKKAPQDPSPELKKRLVEGAQKFVGDEPDLPGDSADADMREAARRVDALLAKKKDPE